MGLTLTAILLGIVEGLTEFVPVSSTGHVILAVVVLYWKTFWNAGMGVLRREPEGLRFARNLLVAFVPSAILGKLFKDQIDVMLGTPAIVGWALIAGGIAIL